VLLAMMLLMALGGGLLMVVTTEIRVAAHYRDGVEAFHAADALVERIRAELRQVSDVTAVLTGAFTSTLVDGLHGGDRMIGGVTINLTDITHLELCDRVGPCSNAAIAAVTAERPWGANNPRWRLYAHGWLDAATGAAAGRPVYLVAWVGDDPDEDDGDPMRDGDGAGKGCLALRVRAYGGHGSRRDIDVVIAGIPARPRIVRWAER
jgi:hypothetical protein